MQGATEWDKYVEDGVKLISDIATLFPSEIVELLVRSAVCMPWIRASCSY